MIRVICGKNGSGKSAFSSWLIEKEPKRTFTNMRLMPLHPRFDDAVEIGTSSHPVRCERCGFGIWDYLPSNCHVLIDEADLFFDAFCFEALRERAWPWFKQHRHFGQDVTLVVQFPDSLYKRIRLLAMEFVLCERETSDTMKGLVSWMYYLWPRSWYPWRRRIFADPKCKHEVRHSLLWPLQASRVFKQYDTFHNNVPTLECDQCRGREVLAPRRRRGGAFSPVSLVKPGSELVEADVIPVVPT